MNCSLNGCPQILWTRVGKRRQGREFETDLPPHKIRADLKHRLVFGLSLPFGFSHSQINLIIRHSKLPKKPHKETCSTLQTTTKATKATKAKQAWFCRFALSGCLMYYGSLKTRKTVRRRHAGCVVPKTQQGNCAGGLSADYRPRIGDTPRLKRYVRLPPVHGRKRATRMHGIVFRQAGCCLQPLIRLHRSGFASGGCCVCQVVKERVLLEWLKYYNRNKFIAIILVIFLSFVYNFQQVG